LAASTDVITTQSHSWKTGLIQPIRRKKHLNTVYMRSSLASSGNSQFHVVEQSLLNKHFSFFSQDDGDTYLQ
jgi:hypothetical protein